MKRLVRHKDDRFFKILGFGIIEADHGYKVIIRWINPRSSKWTMHAMIKSALIFLDEREENGIATPEIKWKV
jgi:hypothetical protein